MRIVPLAIIIAGLYSLITWLDAAYLQITRVDLLKSPHKGKYIITNCRHVSLEGKLNNYVGEA